MILRGQTKRNEKKKIMIIFLHLIHTLLVVFRVSSLCSEFKKRLESLQLNMIWEKKNVLIVFNTNLIDEK